MHQTIWRTVSWRIRYPRESARSLPLGHAVQAFGSPRSIRGTRSSASAGGAPGEAGNVLFQTQGLSERRALIRFSRIFFPRHARSWRST